MGPIVSVALTPRVELVLDDHNALVASTALKARSPLNHDAMAGEGDVA